MSTANFMLLFSHITLEKKMGELALLLLIMTFPLHTVLIGAARKFEPQFSILFRSL